MLTWKELWQLVAYWTVLILIEGHLPLALGLFSLLASFNSSHIGPPGKHFQTNINDVKCTEPFRCFWEGL